MRRRFIINLATAAGNYVRQARALISVSVSLAAVVVCVLSGAGPAAAAKVDLRATGLGAPEPTIHTQVSVDGEVGGTVPPPPADVMGTPSDSTLVQSDQLYMTKIDGSGATFNQWATVDPSKPDTGGIGDQGGYGAEDVPRLLD